MPITAFQKHLANPNDCQFFGGQLIFPRLLKIEKKSKNAPSNSNLIDFRLKRAKARKLIISAKSQSWHSFVQSLNYQTPTTQVWNKIKSIKGIFTPNTITALYSNNQLSHDNVIIDEEIGQYFRDTFSLSKYSPDFTHVMNINKPLLLSEYCFSDKDFNANFSIIELNIAVNKSKDQGRIVFIT